MNIKSKKFWIRGLRDISVFLIIIYAVGVYQARNLPDTMPAFQGNLISGEVVDVQKMLKQGPIIIYFWGSWCPMCRFTSSTISDLSQSYPVLSIALSSGDKQEIMTYLQENDYHFPVINDPDGEVSQQWHVSVTPTVLIVNAKGEISSKMVGVSSSWGIKFRYWFDALM